jgi:hypothetical protein
MNSSVVRDLGFFHSLALGNKHRWASITIVFWLLWAQGLVIVRITQFFFKFRGLLLSYLVSLFLIILSIFLILSNLITNESNVKVFHYRTSRFHHLIFLLSFPPFNAPHLNLLITLNLLMLLFILLILVFSFPFFSSVQSMVLTNSNSTIESKWTIPINVL